MARAAGNSKNYGVSVIDQEGKPVGLTYDFPSVTTIIGATLNKGDSMVGWAQNVTIDGCLELVKKGYDIAALEPGLVKGLLNDYGFTPYQKRDDAADRGTDAHDVLEAVSRKNTIKHRKELTDTVIPELPEAHRGYAQAAVAWASEHKIKPRLVEVPLLSFEHRFAGTLDLLAEVDGILTLVDGKTSKRIYDSHIIQLGAYDIALNEHGHKPEKFCVLRLAEDGTFEFKEVRPDPEVFLTLRHVYRLTKGI